MWVEKITLENIKLFQKQDICFASKSKPYLWINLLGKNGVGKSTLLQALALLLAGPEAARKLSPQPKFWVREPSTPGKVKITLHRDPIDRAISGENSKKKQFSYSYLITGNQQLEIYKEWYSQPTIVPGREKGLNWLRKNAFSFYEHGWFAAGYGIFRRMSRSSEVVIPGKLEKPNRAGNFISLFNDDYTLSSFEQWMVYLDFRLAKAPDDTEAKRMRDLGEAAIERVLPENIKIAEVTPDGLIQFDVDGKRVSALGLADGYRSMIAFASDLIWRVLQAFPGLENLEEARGVVLIDELESHLHPAWQRKIADWLRDVFPKIQFIVATHSPLIVAGSGDDALTLLLEVIDGESKVSPITNMELSALDADHLLRSPAFGLESTYSPETQKKIERYHELFRRKDRLNKHEKEELEELREFMKEAQPIGGPPEPNSLEARINAFLEETLPQ